VTSTLTAVAGAAESEQDPIQDRTRGASLTDWVRLIRPRQWVKNGFVLAPLLFSGLALHADAVVDAVGAFCCFCLVASGIYCWNDVVDRVADRAHPVKRHRPVASGRIRPVTAAVAGTVFVAAALALGLYIAPSLALVLAIYAVLNIAYSSYLKHIVLVDVFAIAAFFVLRLLAGVTAIGVHASMWLLLCGGLLSLYLGFAKRRHELTLLGADSFGHRAVLEQYDAELLDHISGILLAVTIVSYIMYTMSSHTAAAVGSEALSYSTVFVLYGVFRYVYLVRHQHGGDPAGTLLTDRALLVDVGLWLVYCGWIVYRPF
jgi:4-hydroxybenzoate polyprenyltransferase